MNPTPALLIAVPLIGAALGRLPIVARARRYEDVVALVTCGIVTGLAVLALPSAVTEPSVHWVGGWEPMDGVAIGVPLVMDGVAVGIIALAGLLTSSVVVYAMGDYERLSGLFHVLTLLLLAAVNGFVLAGDLLSMFVFIELLGITTYALTAYKVDDVGSVPAAFAIAVTSTIGAVVFLTGVTLIYGVVGTPNLAGASGWLAELGVAGRTVPSLVVAAGLLVAGLSAKAGLVPLHFAHADSHAAALAPHAGLFGAVTVPAGLYGIARLMTALVDPIATHGRTLLLVVAVATALVGGAMAVCQRHLKRLLAFSSISHLGIAATGVGLASPDAMAGTLLYVLGHGPLKLALFLAVGAILHRLGSVDVDELAGRWRDVRSPIVVLAIGGVMLAGAPPGGLYLGKTALDIAASEAGRGWVMVVVYTAAVLTGAAVLRAVVHLVAGWPAGPDLHGEIVEGRRETTLQGARLPLPLVIVPSGLLAASVALPVVPDLIIGVTATAQRFLDPGAYRSLVLDGQLAAVAGSSLDVFSWPGMGKSGLAVVAAAGLGVAAAHDRPATRRTRAGTPLRLLRQAHSGHLGDYVMWACVGVAVWCGGLVVAVAR